MSRILVIDDSPSTLEALATMLVSAGHQVRSCADGKRARQMIAQEEFDLIVTDIFMPEEDGLEVIRKARKLRPNLPIVAISGMGGTLDMLPVAKRLGAGHVLRKPFSGADLLAVVGRAVAPPPAPAGERKTPSGKTGHGR